MFNGSYIVSELEDVIESGCWSSILDYDTVEWFVDEVIKLENKMPTFFKNTKEEIILTEEDGENYSKKCLSKLRKISFKR